MQYTTSKVVTFPEDVIMCCVNWDPQVFTTSFPVQLSLQIEKVLWKELDLERIRQNGGCLIGRLVKLPTLGVTKDWTGVVSEADWAKANGTQVPINGTFIYYKDQVYSDKEEKQCVINIECIGGTVQL